MSGAATAKLPLRKKAADVEALCRAYGVCMLHKLMPIWIATCPKPMFACAGSSKLGALQKAQTNQQGECTNALHLRTPVLDS